MTVAVCVGVDEFRRACDAARVSGGLGLVPTMGALHEGHLSLIREARRHAPVVAVSIFVNPTQFAAGEDLDAYPRELERDVEKCASAGAELVFAPSAQAMYPAGAQTSVRVGGLTQGLCGTSRPAHFEGVATIVTKLFAVAGPCTAVFGRKDYQQWKTIERMAADLLLPVRVVGAPIVREPDGLAMSSRNRYLSPAERARALALSLALRVSRQAFSQGERRTEVLRDGALAALGGAGLRVDYVALCDTETLSPFVAGSSLPERALLALAAFSGATRLIDNSVLGEDDLIVV